MLVKMLRDEDLKTKRSYSEVSGKMLAFIKKNFTPKEFDEILIPAEEAQIVDSTIELLPGEKFLYQRKINGEMMQKMMIGKTGNKIKT